MHWGNEALHLWAGQLAEATSARLDGHFNHQQFEAQVLQGFSGLMMQLLHACAGGDQDLSLLAREGRVADDHAGLIEAVRVRRLLIHVDNVSVPLAPVGSESQGADGELAEGARGVV